MAKLFDMIIFDRPVLCPRCGAQIDTGYVKGFAGLLHEYHVGDCVALPEVTELSRHPQRCLACDAYTGEYYYLAVYRGILIGITPDLRSAQILLQTLAVERLAALYHDLYRRSEQIRRAAWQKQNAAQASDVASGPAENGRRAAARAELDGLLEQILAAAEARAAALQP